MDNDTENKDDAEQHEVYECPTIKTLDNDETNTLESQSLLVKYRNLVI